MILFGGSGSGSGSGSCSEKPYDPATDVPDLTGKVMMVTGGNAGLGKYSVLEFARHGAKVYMASRTEAKARESITEITLQVPDARVEFLELDLSSFRSIQAAAAEFVSKETQLHVLLNNAGCMALPPLRTEDGFDIQWGTNYMGHALLTKLLLPTLLRTAAAAGATTAAAAAAGSVRIVNVSSEGHRMAAFGVDLDSGDPTQQPLLLLLLRSSRWLRYGQSKLANILHARALDKRYAAHGVIAVSCHPGIIHTDLYKPFVASLGAPFGALASLLSFPLKYILTHPQAGAHNQIALCTSPALTLTRGDDGSGGGGGGGGGGGYYVPVLRKGSPSRYALDDSLADKLWEYTEKILKEKGY